MTQINFRIEEDIKENAEKALKDMGLTMSSAITMFLVKVGREKRIPFEITADPFYSESNIRYLEKIASDIKNGKATFTEHTLIDGDDWWKFFENPVLGTIMFIGNLKTEKRLKRLTELLLIFVEVHLKELVNPNRLKKI